MNDMHDSSARYIRTAQDVNKVISCAKINQETLLPVTQAIYFTDELINYKLLELNNEVLSELKAGSSVVFRGSKDEKAVLCTESKTYEVKEAETSNALLLVPDLQLPEQFNSSDDKRVLHKNTVGIYHTYYEVKLCKPRHAKLRKLLEISSYRGSELESELAECGVIMYSTYELLEHVQASQQELYSMLKELQAFELNEKWRILEFDYNFRVLSYLLNLVDDHSWPHDAIPYYESVEILTELMPKFILDHLFDTYTEISAHQPNNENECFYKLKSYPICRIYAEVLLKPTGTFGLEDFLKTWQDSVPQGLITDASHLAGLALIDTSSKPKAVYYYPQYQLSEELPERMQQLFAYKAKWTLDQITPYIAPLATDNLDVNVILMKYARACTINGVKIYSARHGK